MDRKLIHDNYNEVVKIIFNQLGLKYSFLTRYLHKRHPLYPSFSSIAHVLSYYGVECCLIQTTIDELREMPTPFVINYDGLFLPISSIDNNSIYIILSDNNSKKEDIKMLNSLWNGYVLVFNSAEIKPPQIHSRQLIKLIFNRSSIIGCILLIGFMIYTLCNYAIMNYDTSELSITGINLLGVFVCLLFQIHEYNKSNKFINYICHSNNKRDCSSILDSAAAKFLNLFTWSDFGMLYFCYLVVLPMLLHSHVAVSIFVIFSILACAYIPYSLYFQWKIAKRWCVLCLVTQMILVLNLLLSLYFIYVCKNIFIVDIEALFRAFTLGVILVICFSSVKQLVNKIIYWKRQTFISHQLKYDFRVKNMIMGQQMAISTTDINTLKINNIEGSSTLTLIFNPTCMPCIRKLRTILDWYGRKNDTKLEFILFIDNDDTMSYKMSLALINAYYNNKAGFQNIIHDYINNYPKSRNLLMSQPLCQERANVIFEHLEWCKQYNITSTPKLFLNGHEVPFIYSPEEIDYLTT